MDIKELEKVALREQNRIYKEDKLFEEAMRLKLADETAKLSDRLKIVFSELGLFIGIKYQELKKTALKSQINDYKNYVSRILREYTLTDRVSTWFSQNIHYKMYSKLDLVNKYIELHMMLISNEIEKLSLVYLDKRKEKEIKEQLETYALDGLTVEEIDEFLETWFEDELPAEEYIDEYTKDTENKVKKIVKKALILGTLATTVNDIQTQIEKEISLNIKKANLLFLAIRNAEQKGMKQDVGIVTYVGKEKLNRYRWVWLAETTACPICSAKHGNVYTESDDKPPEHVHCRCWIAYIE